ALLTYHGALRHVTGPSWGLVRRRSDEAGSGRVVLASGVGVLVWGVGGLGRRGFVAGVAGVVRGHEVPLARAFHQGPALVGLEVVVVLAEAIEQLQQRDVAVGPVQAVVGLQA